MLKRILLDGIILLLLTCLVWWWLKPASVPDTQTTLAPAAPVLLNTPMIDMALQAPVKVYAGGAKTKQKMQLPAAVVHNEQQQVIAGTRVDTRDDHPRTITTVIDSRTGETETYITKEPLPWLAWDTRGSAGIYTGFKNGDQVARLQVQQQLFQVKSVHVGALATIDQPLAGAGRQDYFIGVGASINW